MKEPLVCWAVLPRTWILLKSSLNILLEGVPEGTQISNVEGVLLSVDGVKSIHDLHVWALTSGKVRLTAHLVNDVQVDAEREILPRVRDLLARHFGITHIAIQCELTPCRQSDAVPHFESAAQYFGQCGQGKRDQDDDHTEGRHGH
ncbi:Co/Zn/Cd efflux system component [Cupriavidus metallidurans]